jgi:hypothetical protein
MEYRRVSDVLNYTYFDRLYGKIKKASIYIKEAFK